MKRRPAIGLALTLCAAIVVGCRGDAPPPSVPLPVEPAPSGGAEVARSGDDQCRVARERLSEPSSSSVAHTDVSALRTRLESVSGFEVPQLFRDIRAAGPAAAPLVPDLEARLGTDHLELSEGIFRALPYVDRAATIRLGELAVVSADRSLPERQMGANAMASLGRSGLERLSALYRSADGQATTRQVILRGLLGARAYPLALKEVVFPSSGLCFQEADSEPCLDLLQGLLFVWPDASPRADAVVRLLRAEKEIWLGDDDTSGWRELALAQLETHPELVVRSLLRIQSLGVTDGLVEVALAVIRQPRVRSTDRGAQAQWLLSLGSLLDSHRDTLSEAALAVAGEPIWPLIAIPAFIAGDTEWDADQIETIAQFGAQHRARLPQAGMLAVARLGRADRFVAMAPSSLPPGFSDFLAVASEPEADAFVAFVLDPSNDLGVSLELVAAWAAGRRTELRDALLRFGGEPSARAIEVAARAAPPDPELAARLAPLIEETTMSPEIARWMIASLQVDAVVASAASAIGSEVAARRSRAVLWARAAGAELEIEQLVDAVAAEARLNEIELRDARSAAMAAVIGRGGIPLDEAIALVERSPPGSAGAFEAATLLAVAFAANCER